MKDFDFYRVFDIYAKHTWSILLKDKTGIAISNAFQKNLNEPNCKPKKYGWTKALNFTIDQ